MVTSAITNQNRFLTASSACPICHGWDHMKRGYKERCCGYRSADGEYVFCTREQYAGQLEPHGNTTPPAYMHKMHGPCNCGVTHGVALSVVPPSNKKAAMMRKNDDFFGYDDPRAVARYPYYDEQGQLLYTVVRYQWPDDSKPKGYEKTFRQFRWEKGQHVPGLTDKSGKKARTVLYRLQELLKAPLDATIYITEGEQCAEDLRQQGCVATTNVGGAGKWDQEYSGAFKARHVVILPDNDKAGKGHVDTVKASIERIAASLKVVELPGLPEKGDVSDWLKAGGTKEQLVEMVEAAPDLKPPSVTGLPALDEAIVAGNRRAIYDLAPIIAAMPALKLSRLRVELKGALPNFPLREFDDLIREERRKQEAERNRSPEIKSARDLMDIKFAPVQWIVPGILPIGLIALAGKQKIGKSWLDLALSLGVACGGQVLGSIRVAQGDVLYLALEDTDRRMQDRMSQLLPPMEKPAAAFEYAVKWPRMDNGGLEALENWIKARPNPRLIIIDPWAKVKPNVRQKAGATGYDADYEALMGLWELANAYNVCILVQFHLRKMGADDPFDELNGTTGITACADGFLSIKRGRGEEEATLWGTGRDYAQDVDLALKFSRVNGGSWETLGDAAAYSMTKESKEVIDLLKQEGKPLQPKDIARLLDQPQGRVRQRLLQMKNRDEIISTENGYIVKNPNGPNGPNGPNDPNDPNGLENKTVRAPLEPLGLPKYPLTAVNEHQEQLHGASVRGVSSVSTNRNVVSEVKSNSAPHQETALQKPLQLGTPTYDESYVFKKGQAVRCPDGQTGLVQHVSKCSIDVQVYGNTRHYTADQFKFLR